MTIRSTPAFSDISTYTGRLVSILLKCRPFLAEVFFYITDSRGQYPDACGPNPYLAYARPNAIPEAYDLPIGLVNRVLYDHNNPLGE
jgi:phosphatidylinositol glycan class P protein